MRALPLDAVVLIGGCDKTIPAELMGAHQRRHAGDRGPGRPDARRPPRGRAARRLHRLPPAVGGLSRRHPRRRRPRPRARPADADLRHLHGDGHRLDHGLPRRDARLHAAGRGDRAGGLLRARAASPKRPAARASRWRSPAARGRARSSRRRRCATPRWCCRRSAARPTRSSISPRSRGAPGITYDLAELDRVGRDTPVLLDLKPAGEHFMEDFHAGGGAAGAVAAAARPPRPLGPHRHRARRSATIVARWPAYVDDKVIRPLDQPVVRRRGDRDPERLARAARRGDQARRRDHGAVPARGPGARVRLARRPGSSGSTIPTSPVTPAHRHGAAQCRPDRRARHAGSRRAADPEEARQPRRQGHGAHLRRAHERHRVRHRGAACRARKRRPADRSRWSRDGDIIRLDAAARRLDLLVDEAELARRRAGWPPPREAARAAMRGSMSSTSPRPSAAATSIS